MSRRAATTGARYLTYANLFADANYAFFRAWLRRAFVVGERGGGDTPALRGPDVDWTAAETWRRPPPPRAR